jgi:hypothetical protein
MLAGGDGKYGIILLYHPMIPYFPSSTCMMCAIFFEYDLGFFFKIVSGNFKDNAFKSVSDELLDAGKLFEKVTPERRSCLVTFTKCFELVTWLRESIRGNSGRE